MISVGSLRRPSPREFGRWSTGDVNTLIDCRTCRRPTPFTRSGSNHERDERAAIPQHGRASERFWSRDIGLDDELRLERRPEATDLYARTLQVCGQAAGWTRQCPGDWLRRRIRDPNCASG